MRLLTFSFVLLFYSFAATAETYSCQPISSCRMPGAHCQTVDNTEPAGVFELSESEITITTAGETPVVFDLVDTQRDDDSVAYFVRYNLGFAMFTFYKNGTLFMNATRNSRDGLGFVSHLKCAGSPW